MPTSIPPSSLGSTPRLVNKKKAANERAELIMVSLYDWVNGDFAHSGHAYSGVANVAVKFKESHQFLTWMPKGSGAFPMPVGCGFAKTTWGKSEGSPIPS